MVVPELSGAVSFSLGGGRGSGGMSLGSSLRSSLVSPMMSRPLAAFSTPERGWCALLVGEKLQVARVYPKFTWARVTHLGNGGFFKNFYSKRVGDSYFLRKGKFGQGGSCVC